MEAGGVARRWLAVGWLRRMRIGLGRATSQSKWRPAPPVARRSKLARPNTSADCRSEAGQREGNEEEISLEEGKRALPLHLRARKCALFGAASFRSTCGGKCGLPEQTGGEKFDW